MAIRYHDNFRKTIDAGVRAEPVAYNGGDIFALRGGNGGTAAGRAVDVLIAPLIEASKGDMHVNLRDATASELTGYFTSGRASVFVDAYSGVAVGYARLKPRLTSKEKLEFGVAIPETIYEMGTVIVNGSKPDGTRYRENGLAKLVIGDLVQSNRVVQDNGSTLIIATMKEAKTMVAFQNAFLQNGYDSHLFSHHLDFVNVARLTCTCGGNFGSGFNIAPAAVCFARIGDISREQRDTGSEFEALRRLNARDLPRNEEGKLSDEGRKILSPLNGRCVLFVSDAILAHRINGVIDTTSREVGSAVAQGGAVKLDMPARRG